MLKPDSTANIAAIGLAAASPVTAAAISATRANFGLT
jgi:hypothetical protein